MAQIQKFVGTRDDHWDSFSDFAAELDSEFNKLGLRDDVGLNIYPDYLDGEALAFSEYLSSTHRFSSYEEMCETLTTEFPHTNLPLQDPYVLIIFYIFFLLLVSFTKSLMQR